MCGIAAFFSDGGDNPQTRRETLRQIVRRMGTAQAARGPDGCGEWANDECALGCVRLAITGDERLGRQPLEDPWGGILVFNGEIYEHESVLRLHGHRVEPNASDGIALAAVLARHGPEGLRRVSGMFAAARYEPLRRRLLLVRDPVGKKPLYVRRTPGGWVVASTVAALRAASGALAVRREAMHEYLVFRSIGGSHSAFEDVEQLDPGSWMELAPGGTVRRGRWWRPPPPGDGVASAAEVCEAIDRAVAVRARPGSPVGVFVSGGLDSSIVAASLVRQRPDQPVRLFSVGYDVGGPEDERPLAHSLATSLNATYEDLRISAQDVPQLMADVAIRLEDPIQDPVTLPTLALSRRAAAATNVVLTGDGADEVWGGYERFDHVPATVDDYLPRTWIFQPSELGLREFPRSYLDGIAIDGDDLAPLDRVMRLELANRLRNYHLARVDKLTMSVALEARCPFLDVGVLDRALAIPSAIKRPGERPKGLLIAAFADKLPAWVIGRKKQPFTVPVRRWLAGPLRDFARDSLGSSSAFTRTFVSPGAYLDRVAVPDRDGEAAAMKVWSLLQLEAWYRHVASEFRKPVCQ
jgi:asparagine synthase (glutamine-hydrolysing)